VNCTEPSLSVRIPCCKSRNGLAYYNKALITPKIVTSPYSTDGNVMKIFAFQKFRRAN
jgi:hypothetical protein